MSRVRGRNTRFELTMISVLSAELYPLGFRYRKHYRRLFGTPDLVFVKYRIVVFLDSDFWHGRNYDHLRAGMNAFWRAKIERNMARDQEVNVRLRKEGWKVLRFGEKQIKSRPLSVLKRIKLELSRS
jgi:DNA mismatch endonuclease Vsr